jgi:hypothetical protein
MTAADAAREGRASNTGSVISVFIGSLERLPPSHLFGLFRLQVSQRRPDRADAYITSSLG